MAAPTPPLQVSALEPPPGAEARAQILHAIVCGSLDFHTQDLSASSRDDVLRSEPASLTVSTAYAWCRSKMFKCVLVRDMYGEVGQDRRRMQSIHFKPRPQDKAKRHKRWLRYHRRQQAQDLLPPQPSPTPRAEVPTDGSPNRRYRALSPERHSVLGIAPKRGVHVSSRKGRETLMHSDRKQLDWGRNLPEVLQRGLHPAAEDIGVLNAIQELFDEDRSTILIVDDNVGKGMLLRVGAGKVKHKSTNSFG